MTTDQLTTIIAAYLTTSPDLKRERSWWSIADKRRFAEGLAKWICEQQSQPENDTTTVQRLRWMANNSNLTDRQRATCSEAADMIEREKCYDRP